MQKWSDANSADMSWMNPFGFRFHEIVASFFNSVIDFLGHRLQGRADGDAHFLVRKYLQIWPNQKSRNEEWEQQQQQQTKVYDILQQFIACS